MWKYTQISASYIAKVPKESFKQTLLQSNSLYSDLLRKL